MKSVKVSAAFRALCKAGYYAKQQTAVPDENRDAYVVLVPNDRERLDETGKCYLHWAGDPEQIANILRESGLIVEHDGSLYTRIQITDPDIIENLFDGHRRAVDGSVLRGFENVENHPRFSAIVRMGRSVVPFLVRELRTKGAKARHWCQALAAITGEDPVPEEARGKTHKIVEAWLKLAREKQWEPMIEVCVTVEVVKTKTLIGTLTVQAQDAAAAQQIVEAMIAEGRYDVPHTNIVWQHDSTDKQKTVSVVEAQEIK